MLMLRLRFRAEARDGYIMLFGIDNMCRTYVGDFDYTSVIDTKYMVSFIDEQWIAANLEHNNEKLFTDEEGDYKYRIDVYGDDILMDIEVFDAWHTMSIGKYVCNQEWFMEGMQKVCKLCIAQVGI